MWMPVNNNKATPIQIIWYAFVRINMQQKNLFLTSNLTLQITSYHHLYISFRSCKTKFLFQPINSQISICVCIRESKDKSARVLSTII